MDAWTSPNHRMFVAFVVHFVQEGMPMSFPLDMVEVPKSHTGDELAKVFAKVLEENGMSEKGGKGTEVEGADIHKLADGLLEEESVMQDTIAGDDDKIQDNDDDGLVDDVSALTEDKRKNLLATIKPVKMALMKLRCLAFKIIHLTTIVLPAWKETLETLGLEVHLMLHDVATHWNSSGNMVDFTINYQEGIEVLTQKKNLGLREFELSDEEWAVLRELCEVLKILKDTTLYFSCASPNLATVIPAMDHIDKEFTMYALDASSYSPPIRAALEMAKKTLNRYYARTDESHLYHIAMDTNSLIFGRRSG
ncbi:hypothetical protein SCLCIDRAFT_34436 [Scleroderma citrinum Foug A]|uniref:DUF659 domain-containing protein n=1 Tax=Scleroderma citrinum Foug A TaxID=1036808 RepID=A0A0C3D1K3_9AGAM|nr:hypothetical protein SCLCIDRAFT_34436 [Scleroderma citrinum Foug A]